MILLSEAVQIVLLYLVLLLISILIIRNIAKKNEWDTSFTKAFAVVFSWMVISIIFGLISNFVYNLILWETSTEGLFITLRLFLNIIIIIFSYSTAIIVVTFIIKRIYEGELRDSFSMILVLLIDQIILGMFIPFLPFLVILVPFLLFFGG